MVAQCQLSLQAYARSIVHAASMLSVPGFAYLTNRKVHIYSCKINKKNIYNLQFINKIKMQWKIENLI